MREAVVTPDSYLNEIASHLIVAGGKRLRPGRSPSPPPRCSARPASYDVVRGGVACELVHLGSLYHDDVMDEADTRRGVETVNAKWGNLQAILAGDFLLARASEIAASLGTEVAGLLARTIGWLCEGQIEELRHTYDITRTEESYLASIHGKTASLYGTAARIGGIVAGHDRVVIDALTEYGNAYGIVFQIVDDILDVTATDEQLGKPAGHDMIEGVYTLPVIRTLALGNAAAAELARTARHAARPRPARHGARHRAQQRRRRLGDRHRPRVRRPGRSRLRRLPRLGGHASRCAARPPRCSSRSPSTSGPIAPPRCRSEVDSSATRRWMRRRSASRSTTVAGRDAWAGTSWGRVWTRAAASAALGGTAVVGAEFAGGDAQRGAHHAVAAHADAQHRAQRRRAGRGSGRRAGRPCGTDRPTSASSVG